MRFPAFLSLKKIKKGFTLIELVVSVAIVTILISVSIPAYQSYAIKGQITEALVLVSGVKPLIAEYYGYHGKYPTNDLISFTGYTGKYVKQTWIESNGKIVASLGNDANSAIANKYIYLVPYTTTVGNIDWKCQSDALEKHLPSSCAHIDTLPD